MPHILTESLPKISHGQNKIVSVFIYMNTETDSKAYKFWSELSSDERVEFLSENRFWDGFSHYLYDYLPDDLQALIVLKTA